MTKGWLSVVAKQQGERNKRERDAGREERPLARGCRVVLEADLWEDEPPTRGVLFW